MRNTLIIYPEKEGDNDTFMIISSTNSREVDELLLTIKKVKNYADLKCDVYNMVTPKSTFQIKRELEPAVIETSGPVILIEL